MWVTTTSGFLSAILQTAVTRLPAALGGRE
jgi:hypothetical protein